MTFTHIDNLPRFELLSKLDKISSLNHHDVENNFMQQTDFKYYTLEDFLSNENLNQSKYTLSSLLFISTLEVFLLTTRV